MTDTDRPAKQVSNPDSINELVIVGEFGFDRHAGPWSVEKEGTKWTVIRPYDDLDRALGSHVEGERAVLIADGRAVGGGVVDAVFAPEDEGEEHVVVDQYAMGD